MKDYKCSLHNLYSLCITLVIYSLFADPVGQALYRLLLIEAFRPDRLISAAHIFVDAVMGASFMQAAEHKYDLAEVVENEVSMTS